MKVDDELAESGELRETKRRKVSSTKDSEDTQTGTAVSNKGDKWLLCLFLLWFLTLVKTPVFILSRGSIESGQGR